MDDPILTPDNRRFVLFPIRDQEIYDAYKRLLADFWVAEEIPLTEDVEHLRTRVSPEERALVERVLAFFAASDGIVLENIAVKFYGEVQLAEARAFYSAQIINENVHSETYSLLIDTYVRDDDRKTELFEAVERDPVTKLKADWALRWMGSDRPFCERLVAFSAVEGILFSSSFALIFYLKHLGKLPGLALANEFISRDENEHAKFAALLHSRLVERCDEATIHTIIQSAVEVELQFVESVVPRTLPGMSPELMSQHVKFTADLLLKDYYKVQPIYDVGTPFPWMATLSIPRASNFFETRVTNYQKPNVVATGGKKRDDALESFGNFEL